MLVPAVGISGKKTHPLKGVEEAQRDISAFEKINQTMTGLHIQWIEKMRREASASIIAPAEDVPVKPSGTAGAFIRV